MTKRCPFCEIMSHFPALTVAIIEPLNPVTEGHRIVIPRSHVADAGEDPSITATVMRAASEYAALLDCDYNLITSSGPNATQSIRHLHIHIVPRRKGDGLRLPWTDQKIEGLGKRPLRLPKNPALLGRSYH